MASQIKSDFIGAGNVDKAQMRLQLDTAQGEITELQEQNADAHNKIEAVNNTIRAIPMLSQLRIGDNRNVVPGNSTGHLIDYSAVGIDYLFVPQQLGVPTSGFTIPPGYGGAYDVDCSVQWLAAASVPHRAVLTLFINNSPVLEDLRRFEPNIAGQLHIRWIGLIADGAVIQTRIRQDSGVPILLPPSSRHFTVQRLHRRA